MKAIIFDAFGTLFKVTSGGSAKTIMKNIIDCGMVVDENGLMPHEVLFVGDSITDDILGPKAIGIKTVWIDRNGIGGNIGQDYTITDLNGLIHKTIVTIQSQSRKTYGFPRCGVSAK